MNETAVDMKVAVNESLSMSIASVTAVEVEVDGSIRLDFDLSETPTYSMSVDENKPFDMELGEAVVVNRVSGETYDGDYTVTPTTETQTLATSYLVCTDNITINPIPSNYGLVTWNGSYLTVS